MGCHVSFYPEAIQAKNWRREAQQIIKNNNKIQTVSERMQRVAERFAGRPYIANALHGGAQTAERLVLDLDGFDCVTLVENVIALARARDLPGYVAELLHLRYRTGQVQWSQRLHYFSDWMQVHVRRGLLNFVEADKPLVYEKMLDSLADYPARMHKIFVCPRKQLLNIAPRLGESNVVAFASTRAGIDYFHVGLLFWQGDAETQILQLVHASRSAAGVVSEPLADFLHRNRMRGLKLARIREF